jgi:hypothetical protein
MNIGLRKDRPEAIYENRARLIRDNDNAARLSFGAQFWLQGRDSCDDQRFPRVRNNVSLVRSWRWFGVRAHLPLA